MAFRTSELRLILTARNEVSRTLRRVGRDMGRLGRQEAVQQQIRQNQALQKRQQLQRLGLRHDLQSLTVGKQRLDLERRIANQMNAVQVAQRGLRAARREQNILTSRNYEQQIENLRALDKVNKDLSVRRITAFRREQLQYRKEVLETRGRRLAKEEADIPSRVDVARTTLGTQTQGLRALRQAEVDAANKAQLLRARIKSVSEELNITRDKAADLVMELDRLNGNKIRQVANSAMHAGVAMATVGTIATASFGVAARAAANFSKEITLAATQARPLDKSFAFTAKRAGQLNDIVLDQMQKFPATSQEMADSLYEIFSGTNIDKPRQAAAALETLNKAAVAGGTDLGTMTQAGITLLNNFVGADKEFKTLADAIDMFFSAVRYGRFSAKQFADSLSNVIPIAQTAGLSFKDVATAMATLTRQSGARFTSRDATGLARLIEIFGKTDIQAGLLSKGISVEKATGGMRPLLDIMREIKDEANLKPGASTLNFFKELSKLGGLGEGNAGTIQARRTFAFLIQNMQEYEDTTKKVIRTQGEFNASYRAMAKTPGVRWDVFMNQMKALVIIIGQSAIPVFQKLGFYIVRVTQYFNNMDKDTRDMIVRIAVITSVAVAIGGALAAIGAGFVVAGIALRGFLGSMSLFGGAKLASDVGLSAAQFGIVGAAAAAALLIFAKYPKIFTEITDALGGLETILKMISYLFLAFTAKRIIDALATMRAGAVLATADMVALRLALLRLTIIGAITIPIIQHYSTEGEKDPRITGEAGGGGGRIEKFFRDVKVPGVKQIFTASEKVWLDAFDDLGLTKQAKVAAQMKKENARFDFMKNQADIINLHHQIMQNPYIPAFLKDLANQAVSAGDLDTLRKIDRLRVKISTGGGARTFGSATAGDRSLTGSMTQAKQDKVLARALTNLAKLKQAFDDSVGLAAIPAMRAYDDALAALVIKFPQYKDKINDLLQAFMQLADIRMPDLQFAAAFANLETLRKAAEKSTDRKVIEKYLKAQEALAKKSSDTQMSAAEQAAQHADDLRQEQIQKAKEAAAKAKQLAEDAAERAKRNAQNASDALKTITGNLLQFYQTALQENKSAFGTLFQGPFMQSAVMQNRQQFGQSIRGQDLVADMFSQVRQFKKFQDSLSALRQRGAPEELISQIRQLGPEAQNQIDTLLKLPAQGKNSWQKFVGFFNSGQRLIEQATQKDLNRQIKKWESFGKKVARAIMLGISSETPGLENALWNRMLKMFPGLAAQAHAKPKQTNFPGTGATDAAKRMFELPGKNPGMLKAGNLDLLHRKVADLKGGGIATVESFSVEINGKEILLPAVINGIVRSQEFAKAYFAKTGQNLGTFTNPAAANAYAERLHQQQAGFYAGKGKSTGAGKGAGAGQPQYSIVNNKNVHYNLPSELAGSTLMSQFKAAYFYERNRD